MAEYPDFKHGTRAKIDANGVPVSDNGDSLQAIVYIGTAPVHLVEGGVNNVNKPILVRDMSEARKYLGYSDDWAAYTLCEAMQAGNLAGIYLIASKQPIRYSYGVQTEIYMAKSMNIPLFVEFYDGNEADEHLLPVRNGLRLAEGGEFVHENWSE